MNYKIKVIDNFYDKPIEHRFDFYENLNNFSESRKQEIRNKLEESLQRKLEVSNIFHDVQSLGNVNKITANSFYDWIAVIYFSLPTVCVGKTGLQFYTHKKTNLDSYLPQIRESGFNIEDKNEWNMYADISLKYNRAVLFRGNCWHSYGEGFGTNLNTSMISQRILIKNARIN